MKGYKGLILLLPALITGFAGCKNNEGDNVEFEYIDFAHPAADAVITGGVDAEETYYSDVASHPEAFRALAEVMGVDAAEPNQFLQLSVIKGFAKDIDSISPSSEQMIERLNHIIKVSQKEGIGLPVNRFVSTIWGKPQSILFCDSCMLIAFNHYLGAEHPAYASLDSYRRQTKSKSAMDYDIVEALVATQYPFEKTELTALVNRLIYEGVLTEAKMRMVKNASLADALGYNDEQMKWLTENEKDIWNKIVSSKLLFDGSATMIERFVSPAPFTSPLSTETPGRAGRYIGYKIVKKYLDEHPGTSLSELLTPEFYNKANPLADMRYTGGK